MLVIEVAPHPLLEMRAFTTAFAVTLDALPSPDWLIPFLGASAPSPVSASEDARRAIRDLLRCTGFKPTGRSKPASEYLVRAASEGTLRSINAAVDACNAVSLHSALPISVVDTDRLVRYESEFRLRIQAAERGTNYVFNASGQIIDVGGLLCLFDAQGPCGSPVKDAQRTKTTGETRSTLSIVWGTNGLTEHLERSTDWYRELLERLGGRTQAVP